MTTGEEIPISLRAPRIIRPSHMRFSGCSPIARAAPRSCILPPDLGIGPDDPRTKYGAAHSAHSNREQSTTSQVVPPVCGVVNLEALSLHALSFDYLSITPISPQTSFYHSVWGISHCAIAARSLIPGRVRSMMRQPPEFSWYVLKSDARWTWRPWKQAAQVAWFWLWRCNSAQKP